MAANVGKLDWISCRVCVCVTLGIIGILSDCFSFTVVFLVQQGDMAYNQGPCPTKLPDCTGNES